jgi:hypothetical protein
VACAYLLAGLTHYAMSRRSIIPTVSRRTLNGSAVVVIGVDRRGVGSGSDGGRIARPEPPREGESPTFGVPEAED